MSNRRLLLALVPFGIGLGCAATGGYFLFFTPSGASHQSLMALMSIVLFCASAIFGFFQERKPFNRDMDRAHRPFEQSRALLIRCVDLIPGKRLRKRVRKMVADEAAHAEAMLQAQRPTAARWILYCAWVYAIWLVLRGPFEAVLDWVKRPAA